MLLVVGQNGWRLESEAVWEMLQREREEKARATRDKENARREAFERLYAPANIKRFIAAFADENGIEVERLLGLSRVRSIMELKVELTGRVYIAFPRLSIAQLGKYLGGMDHTTIIHRLQKYCDRHGLTYPPTKANSRSLMDANAPAEVPFG